jgi:hypothetical protein
MGLTVLSLGAGVNSTALIVLKAQGKIDFDFAIMAQTGDEHPKTDKYITEHLTPYCKKHGIELVFVKNEKYDSLKKYCESKKIIPSQHSGSCRDKFKIRVIRKYLKKYYPLYFKNIEILIGFCVGEEKRRKGFKGITGNTSFPLMELGLTRLGCAMVIKNAGLPIPPKSGCWYCPRQSIEQWIKLYTEEPELFAKAEEFEKNGRRYPEIFLTWDYPLEVLRRSLEAYSKQAGPEEKDQVERALYAFMPKTSGCAMCEVEDNSCLIDALSKETISPQLKEVS